MSKLRSINTIIWSDPWFELLEPSAKLLFIYLVTNEKTNMLGVYEISIRKVSFETGIKQSEIERYLKEFELSRKIKYAENRVLLLNFLKHQNYNFNMIKSAIRTYNKLPLSLKNDITIIPETQEGFETLCKGFSGVRKIETEYEIETEIETEDEVEITNDIYFPIEVLKQQYLKNDRICEAFISNTKNNIKDLVHLENRLSEFVLSLQEVGRSQETFSEFTKYFRNWNKKAPPKETQTGFVKGTKEWHQEINRLGRKVQL